MDRTTREPLLQSLKSQTRECLVHCRGQQTHLSNPPVKPRPRGREAEKSFTSWIRLKRLVIPQATMERLAGPNHAAWEATMRDELERLGLWGAVNPHSSSTGAQPNHKATRAPAERQRAEMATRAIVDSLEPHVLREVLMSAPPWNLWKVLHQKYHDEPFGCVIDSASSLLECKAEPGTEGKVMEKHLIRMERYIETLNAMGLTLTEEIEVVLLLRSVQQVTCVSRVLQQIRRLPRPPTKAELLTRLRGVATESDRESETPRMSPGVSSSSSSSSWSCVATSKAPEDVQPAPSALSPDMIRAFTRVMEIASDFSVAREDAASSSSTPSTELLEENAVQLAHTSSCACSCKSHGA